MRQAILKLVFVCLLTPSSVDLEGQDLLPDSLIRSTIRELSNRMDKYYVEPELAKRTNIHLRKQLESGRFRRVSNLADFAISLTKELRSVSKDQHLLVRPVGPARSPVANSTEAFLARHRARVIRERENAGGFKEAKVLEGNVGYLNLRSFASLRAGRDHVDGWMNLLSGTNAIIIDLRENGGGYPQMVQYFCSYFFDQPVHLNSLYWRDGDRTQEFWSLEKVNGKKMPEVPMFILVGKTTFSAAEEFSYNMQTRKRATLLGQTTRGGANPGKVFRLNDQLEVIIPIGKAINPITKTNWEGVGVIPDIKTPEKLTFEKAHELAKTAAKEFGAKRQARFEQLSSKLVDCLESFDSVKGNEVVYQELKSCQQAGLLDQQTIKVIGYEYLMNFKKPKVAEAIFRANTLLFPEEPTVFAAYAEALALNEKLEQAAKFYHQAIKIAESSNHPQLQRFQDNLRKLEPRLKKNKN